MPTRARFRALTATKGRARLNGINDALVEEVMIKEAEGIIDIMSKYPDQNPDSRYVRTFDLKAAWNEAREKIKRVRKTPSAWTVSFSVQPIDSRGKRYAPWVHGGFFGTARVEQQDIHAETGWANLFEVLGERDILDYRSKIQAALRIK